MFRGAQAPRLHTSHCSHWVWYAQARCSARRCCWASRARRLQRLSWRPRAWPLCIRPCRLARRMGCTRCCHLPLHPPRSYECAATGVCVRRRVRTACSFSPCSAGPQSALYMRTQPRVALALDVQKLVNLCIVGRCWTWAWPRATRSQGLRWWVAEAGASRCWLSLQSGNCCGTCLHSHLGSFGLPHPKEP